MEGGDAVSGRPGMLLLAFELNHYHIHTLQWVRLFREMLVSLSQLHFKSCNGS